MRTASTVREILVPKTQLLLSGAPGVKVGFKVMGEGQAVTGRLACGGPSGLASGPRQGPMQQGRPLSIPPCQASYKGLAYRAFGNRCRNWLHLQSRAHRRWPWRPQRWWESFRGLSVLPQPRGRWRQQHSGAHIPAVVCCKLMATCRCDCVQVTYCYDTGFAPHKII